MLVGTVASTSSRALLAACKSLGLDPLTLLSAAGLDPNAVDDPDARLPSDAVARLFREALVRSGEPDLPLRAAAAVPFGAYKIIDFLAASASTVGDGLGRVARYFPIINNTAELLIVRLPGEVQVELRAAPGTTELPRPYVEYALAVTFLHCRHAAGFAWPLSAVHFTFSASQGEAHQQLFGCPIRFDQGQHALVVANDVWDAPSAGASSSALLQVLERHADELVSSLQREGPTLSSVTRVLSSVLRDGDPSLNTVAKRLHVSPRTLQRRLHGEGASFADVVDRVRRSLADVYLRQRELALSEVAYLLGFSEQSAFTRAFQRWHGVSPSHYRLQLVP